MATRKISGLHAKKLHKQNHTIKFRHNGQYFAIFIAVLLLAGGIGLVLRSRAAVDINLEVITVNQSPGPGVRVKAGDTIKYQVGYRNRSAATQPEGTAIESTVPPGTTLTFQGDGGYGVNPYVYPDRGFATGPGWHNHSAPNSYVWWYLEKIPPNGAPYFEWGEFYYQFKVNQNLKHNTQLCVHTDIHWGNIPGYTKVSPTICNTVDNPPPKVTVKANGSTSGPINVYLNNPLTINWEVTRAAATSCVASNGWNGAKAVGGGSENRTGDTSSVRSIEYKITCANSGGDDNSKVTVSVIKSPAPSAPANLRVNGSASSSSIPLAWNASTAGAGSSIANYSLRDSTGRQIAAPTGTSLTVGSLQACTSYSFTVVAVNNQGTASGASNQVTASTTGCPSGTGPQPGKPPTQGGGGTPVVKPGNGTSGGTTRRPSGSSGGTTTPAAPVKPAKPEGFTANITGSSPVVSLFWSPAANAQKYQLEKSLDQSIWEVLSTDITTTAYLDLDTTFNKNYYYQLKAINGNESSDYAATSVKTGEFAPNVKKDEMVTLSSKDKKLTVIIPVGALKQDAVCEIFVNNNNKAKISQKLSILAGPYSLVCKDSQAVSLRTDKDLEATIRLSDDEVKNFNDPALYRFDSSRREWVSVGSKYDKNNKTYSFKTNDLDQFAILGVNKSSRNWIWLIITLLVAALGFGLWWFLKKRQRPAGGPSLITRPGKPVAPAPPELPHHTESTQHETVPGSNAAHSGAMGIVAVNQGGQYLLVKNELGQWSIPVALVMNGHASQGHLIQTVNNSSGYHIRINKQLPNMVLDVGGVETQAVMYLGSADRQTNPELESQGQVIWRSLALCRTLLPHDQASYLADIDANLYHHLR